MKQFCKTNIVQLKMLHGSIQFSYSYAQKKKAAKTQKDKSHKHTKLEQTDKRKSFIQNRKRVSQTFKRKENGTNREWGGGNSILGEKRINALNEQV